jgi:fluoroquinolone transport system ATP-binding protein
MIDVKNLTFTCAKTNISALAGLNFAVERGEIFGYLGPSGAGKSTTQKILIGLLKGYQGHVAVFGQQLTDWRQDYYQRVGVAFELPNHFRKLTALENLAYFSSCTIRLLR